MGFEVDSQSFISAARLMSNVQESVASKLNEGTRKVEPEWRRLVSANASTAVEKRIIAAGARAVASDGGVRLESNGGRVRNGLNAADHGGSVEFGVKRGKKSTYRRRSRRNGSHSVTRVTTNQLKPFRKAGYVFTPAVKAFFPKLAKAWNEAFADTVEEALNGKG